MKKFVAALLVLTMVLAMTSIAFAYKEKALNDGDGIFVQFKGSAWGYGKVTNNYGKNKSSVALRKGSIAKAVAIKGDWYKIEVPTRGMKDVEYFWFNKKYTKASDADEAKLIYSSGGSGRNENGEAAYEEAVKKLKTVKTSGKVNLRKGPGLAGKSLGTVKKGKKVTLTGYVGYDSRDILFVQVKAGGKKGYISTVYVRSSDVKKIKSKLGE